jgi:hypothetical protein
VGSENSRGGRSPREQRRICLRKLGGIRTDSRREESFEVGELLTESEFATCCPRELGDARKRVEKDSIGVGRKKEKRARASATCSSAKPALTRQARAHSKLIGITAREPAALRGARDLREGKALKEKPQEGQWYETRPRA